MTKKNKIREVIEEQRKNPRIFKEYLKRYQIQLLKAVIEEIEKAQEEKTIMMEIAKINDLKTKLEQEIKKI